MSKCFVIQPFDKGKFDKRYDAVFAPAISKAELEPYRVDRDPRVNIPIETIESEIRDASICLADITTDNPNVWYELGYAIAYGKEVVLVCSNERTAKFPFDVQHRNIISYAPESPQDFIKLGDDITVRLMALMKKQRELQTVSSLSPIKDTEGLSPHEIITLMSAMERTGTLQGDVSIESILQDVRSAGFTDLAGSLSVASLQQKEMLKLKQGFQRTFQITEKGADWLINNQDKLKLKQEN
jgi:hypothetical protein